MKFKGKKHGFIKTANGFVTINKGVEIELAPKYMNHTLLEPMETMPVKETVPEMRKKKDVPKGVDKNNDGVVTDKEMAAHLGSKGGKKSASNRRGKKKSK